MEQNVGKTDRLLRTLIGAAAGAASLAILAGAVSAPAILSPLLGVLAIIALGTAATSTWAVRRAGRFNVSARHGLTSALKRHSGNYTTYYVLDCAKCCICTLNSDPDSVDHIDLEKVPAWRSAACQADSEIEEEHLLNFVVNSLDDDLPIDLGERRGNDGDVVRGPRRRQRRRDLDQSRLRDDRRLATRQYRPRTPYRSVRP